MELNDLELELELENVAYPTGGVLHCTHVGPRASVFSLLE